MSDLEIDIRRKRYPPAGGSGPHLALENLCFAVRRGEFVCVLGPSGCGKTTLLNVVAGLDRDFEGRIALPASADRPEPVLGYVFQNPRLLPWRTVIENIDLVLSPAQARSGIAQEMLAAAGLQDFADSYPERLSVGMARRVALARAFALRPDLLLMDEPFVSLDEANAQRLRRLLLEIWDKRPTTVLFVTHDLREAVMLADRIILLSAAPGAVEAELPLGMPRSERDDPAVIARCRRLLFGDGRLSSTVLLKDG